MSEAELIAELRAQRELLEQSVALTQKLADDHEPRLQKVERAVLRKHALISTIVSGVVSLVVALVSASCALPEPKYTASPSEVRESVAYIEIRDPSVPDDPIYAMFGMTPDFGAAGTGWYATPHLVVTAGHVCEPAPYEYRLSVGDSGVFRDAVILYDDDKLDICVLGTAEANPAHLQLAPEAPLAFETPVWYFGFPGGFPALEYGVITGWRDETSALGLDGVRVLVSMDAWYGASGSPVFDADGRVVGLLVEIWTGNGQLTGFVPVEDVYNALEDLIQEADHGS